MVFFVILKDRTKILRYFEIMSILHFSMEHEVREISNILLQWQIDTILIVNAWPSECRVKF